MKTCTKCAQVKPLDEYYRQANRPDGRRAECKSCSLARMVEKHPPKGAVVTRVDCRHCGRSFEYERTTGKIRYYCSGECRYRAGEAAKLARAPGSTRACACGSRDVARVGKAVCSACKKDTRDPAIAYAKERRRTLARYGLTQAAYDVILSAQNGRCAICYTETPGGRGETWHIDHCHETGMVRGLLCHQCNVGIGHMRDDPNLMVRAATYLTNSKNGDTAWLSRPTEPSRRSSVSTVTA